MGGINVTHNTSYRVPLSRPQSILCYSEPLTPSLSPGLNLWSWWFWFFPARAESLVAHGHTYSIHINPASKASKKLAGIIWLQPPPFPASLCTSFWNLSHWITVTDFRQEPLKSPLGGESGKAQWCPFFSFSTCKMLSPSSQANTQIQWGSFSEVSPGSRVFAGI